MTTSKPPPETPLVIMSWRQELKALFDGFVGRTASVDKPQEKTLETPEIRIANSSKGLAKIYDLQGQDLSEFNVGDLIEIVTNNRNDQLKSSYFYIAEYKRILPLGHIDSVLDDSNPHIKHPRTETAIRKPLFIKDRKCGLVVRKRHFDSMELLGTASEMSIREHGKVEILEVLLDEPQVIIEIWGLTCDPHINFTVKKMQQQQKAEIS